MRKVSIRTFILMAVIIGIFTLFAGCGGSNDIVSTNNSGGNSLIDVPDGGTSSETGTFSVTLSLPATEAMKEELAASVIPVLSRTLQVTLTGDGIGTDNASLFVKSVDITPGSTATVSFTSVPVGLKTAKIVVLDIDGNLLAQRTYAFFLDPGETENPGNIDLGVAIDGTGSCTPSNITIPVGTTLYFENQDTVSAHTVSLSNGALTTGSIPAVTPSDGLAQPAVYNTGTIQFNTGGVFNYDTGFGAPGTVTVIDTSALTITGIDNGLQPPPVINPPTEISDFDDLPPTQTITLTITGVGFGATRELSDGNVQFSEIDPLTPESQVILGTITSWSDTQITLTVTLEGGKYRVEVLAYGTSSAVNSPNVFYNKVLWQNIVDERFSIGQARDLYMYVTDNVNVGIPDPFTNPVTTQVPFLGYLDGAFSNYDIVYSYNADEYDPNSPWVRNVASAGVTALSGSMILRKDAGNNIDIYAAYIVQVIDQEAVPPVDRGDNVYVTRLGTPAIASHREALALFSDNSSAGTTYIVQLSPTYYMKEPSAHDGTGWLIDNGTSWELRELWDVQEIGVEVDQNGEMKVAFSMKDLELNGKTLPNKVEAFYRAYVARYNPLAGGTQQDNVVPNPFDGASYGLNDSGGQGPHNWLIDPANYYYDYTTNNTLPGNVAPEYYGGVSEQDATELSLATSDTENRIFLAFQDSSNQRGTTILTNPRTDTYDAPTTPGSINDQDWPLLGQGILGDNDLWSVVGKPGFSQGVASGLSVDTFQGRPFTLFQDQADGALSLFAYSDVYAQFSTSGWETIGSRGDVGNGTSDISLFIFDPDDGDNGDAEADDPVPYTLASGNVIQIGIPYVAYSDEKGQVKRFINSAWTQVGKVGISQGTATYLSVYVYGKDIDGVLTPVPYVGYADESINQTATVQKFEARPIP